MCESDSDSSNKKLSKLIVLILINIIVQRSPNGIGLTLIGNDGIGNAQPEFIQVNISSIRQ